VLDTWVCRWSSACDFSGRATLSYSAVPDEGSSCKLPISTSLFVGYHASAAFLPSLCGLINVNVESANIGDPVYKISYDLSSDYLN